MPPFGNFTVKAQEAVRRAHELAIERGQNQVDALHLLAALILQDEGIVPAIFEKMDSDPDEVLDAVMASLDAKNRTNVLETRSAGQMFLSVEFGRVLEAAFKIAQAMKDDYISTEHLFLALFDVASCAKNILASSRIEKPQIERALEEV